MENARLSVDELNELSGEILNAAITVHSAMGPGLLESVYQQCMIKELNAREIQVDQNVHIKLNYKDEPIDKDYIIDLLVEGEIIIELKSIETILKVHEAQVVSYLRLANKRVGLLINFNVPLLKQGFRRYVNNL